MCCREKSRRKNMMLSSTEQLKPALLTTLRWSSLIPSHKNYWAPPVLLIQDLKQHISVHNVPTIQEKVKAEMETAATLKRGSITECRIFWISIRTKEVNGVIRKLFQRKWSNTLNCTQCVTTASIRKRAEQLPGVCLIHWNGGESVYIF